jgi:hypothetical protein
MNATGDHDGSTVAGCQTRRDDRVLVAAMLPPLGRSAQLADSTLKRNVQSPLRARLP